MNVLVTGALQGLGSSLTKLLIKNNHNVFALVIPNKGYGDLKEIYDNINLHVIQADLEKSSDIENARKKIGELTNNIDVIINVAGILLNKNGMVIEDTYKDILTTFRVNTVGPMYLNNLFLDMVPNSRESVIINICSEIKTIDDVGEWFPTYCISKTAFTQYCFSLKSTFKKIGIDIRVYAVHPGRMNTAMGGENSEITSDESANGIYNIICDMNYVNDEDIYINYKGENMLT